MMTELFRIILIVGVLIYLLLLGYLMKKDKLNLKYSLLWFLTGLVLIVFAIFPQIIRGLASTMGIYSEINLVFFVGICFLLLIVISLTSIVSVLNDKVRSLTQTQALLEKRVRELENSMTEQLGGEN